MTMKITTAAVIFMGSMVLMLADQLVESVQQALKDDGFYYGEVNGDMNANLTAAIRRYQIRNGLQVSGELKSPAPPVQPFDNAPHDQQVFPSTPMDPATSPGTVFADTPFQTAPPGIQRNVIVSAQIVLARYGLYREQIDGIYGPAMELSLRAYQAQTRLPVTGRLDLETLAALRLLRGPRQEFYNPYRQRMRPLPGPPIRGQWEPD